MRTKEVVVSNPESNVIVIVSATNTVRIFKGTVQTFYHLLERAGLFGHFIIICVADYLSDIGLKGIAEFTEELLGRKRIDTVTVSYESEVYRKIFQMPKYHEHRQDTETDTKVIRYLASEDRVGYIYSVENFKSLCSFID